MAVELGVDDPELPGALGADSKCAFCQLCGDKPDDSPHFRGAKIVSQEESLTIRSDQILRRNAEILRGSIVEKRTIKGARLITIVPQV